MKQNLLNNALSDHFSELQSNNERKKKAEARIKTLTGKIRELSEELGETEG